MAMSVICPNGHEYVQSDNYKDWPLDAPHCPICFKEWADKLGLKVETIYTNQDEG